MVHRLERKKRIKWKLRIFFIILYVCGQEEEEEEEDKENQTNIFLNKRNLWF